MALPLVWAVLQSKHHCEEDHDAAAKPVSTRVRSDSITGQSRNSPPNYNANRHNGSVSTATQHYGTAPPPSPSPVTSRNKTSFNTMLEETRHTGKGSVSSSDSQARADDTLNESTARRLQQDLMTLSRRNSATGSQSNRRTTYTTLPRSNPIVTGPPRISGANSLPKPVQLTSMMRHRSDADSATSRNSTSRDSSTTPHWKYEFRSSCPYCMETAAEFETFVCQKGTGTAFTTVFANALLAIAVTPVHLFTSIDEIQVDSYNVFSQKVVHGKQKLKQQFTFVFRADQVLLFFYCRWNLADII